MVVALYYTFSYRTSFSSGFSIVLEKLFADELFHHHPLMY
jgi:hypothetical protein